MKNLIALFVACFASVAFAGTASQNGSYIDTSKLSKAQVAELAAQAEKMASPDPQTVSATVRKEAEAWGELGANMGKAMVGAAREVGVASNEFAQTSLGKVVVGIVAYKVVGKDLLGVVFGALILTIGYSLAIWILTTKRWSDVQYEYEPILWGMYKKQRILKSHTDSDVVTTKVITGGILIVLTTLVGLKTIF